MKNLFWMDSRLCQSYGYSSSDTLDQKTEQKLFAEPFKQWDAFYVNNQKAFFKDRHWLTKEWPVLLERELVVAELGCGVGNSTLPLLAENDTLQMYCCDYSPTAVDLLRASLSPSQAEANVRTLWVADVSQPSEVLKEVPPGSCDVALLIFVLSAIPPTGWPRVVECAAAVLRPGGCLLLRDYAHGDAAQLRYQANSAARVLSAGGCIRGDGTQAHFFEASQLELLFETHFVADLCEERTQAAQAQGGNPRRFIQATFRRR